MSQAPTLPYGRLGMMLVSGPPLINSTDAVSLVVLVETNGSDLMENCEKSVTKFHLEG